MDERRQHPRIRLLAYGFNHPCQIQMDDGTSLALSIIDISPGGARLALQATAQTPPNLATGVLHLDLKGSRFTIGPTPCEVRWANSPEFGVRFLNELPVGVSDLQRILSE